MLNEMKREIAAALDRLELKRDDAGDVKVVRRAVRDAVAAAVAKKETDQPSVSEIAREAVTSSTERLEKTRAANAICRGGDSGCDRWYGQPGGTGCY